MAGTYKTPGRERLIAFLCAHPDRQFSADEIADRISENSPAPVGKSSLYRHLSELCADGVLRKYRSDRQSAYVYQYIGESDCSHHFHLKCVNCGRLVHLDCTVSDHLLSHVRTDHHFRIDSGRSILYGLCESCGENGEDEENA